MPRTIEPSQRRQEAKQAFDWYTAGVSKNEISKRLGRNYRTVDRLLSEAMAWQESGDVDFKRRALVAGHRQILKLAMEGAEQLQPKSPARAQHLREANESLKAIARVEGLLIQRTETKNYNVDLINELQKHYDAVDAEVVQDALEQ